jgi:hypothetical protein
MVWVAQAAEAYLRAGQQEIAHDLTDNSACRRQSGDHFAIMSVDGERYPHHLAVPTADFQPIRGPALVRGRGDYTAIAGPQRSPAGVAQEEQAVPLHQAEHSLVFKGGLAGGALRPVQDHRSVAAQSALAKRNIIKCSFPEVCS